MAQRFSQGRETVELPASGILPARLLSVGTKVIALRTESGVYNGERFRVTSIEDGISLGGHPPVGDVKLTLAQAQRVLDLAFATTYYKNQGLTIPKGEKVVLLQTSHPRMDSRALLVGMSRPQALEDLAFAPSKWMRLLFEGCTNR